jgi:succinate dehydrogenase hydrophobic anchor subunit
MNIFTPDKSTYLIHKYHYSNKLILPLFVSSYLTSNQTNKIAKYLHFFNLCNFSFHSYFSMSSIITDYVKPKYISNIIRKSNFGLHLFAFVGFSNYIIKQ